ncbi:uncharacterized protein K02A2.6-like [Aedes albopictus]|uniref:Integrase catalytic domain-containing protein n=1 Tax=Aedes albopictus TaxID=7160 RepID=A0ABM1ZYK9_AEDAL
MCATNGRPERPTPMKRVLAPQSVWETIALDFNGPYAKYGGISVLVIVDYRSRYVIARPVKSTSFEHTKRVLEELFEREGFPKSIRSDNGPPFNSEDYASYCNERGIHTTFSTPLFPQQNGLVENSMKLINRAMSAAITLNKNFNDELQAAVNAHNAAAHTVTGVPPEEVFLGRRIKRQLPLLLHKKADFDDDALNRRDMESKLRGKQREDTRRGARKCNVQPGDTVIVERSSRNKGDTRFAHQKYTVLEENNGSLTLSNDEGQVLKRHVTHTRKVSDWREEASNDDPICESSKRPTREKKAPAYLQNYVQHLAE